MLLPHYFVCSEKSGDKFHILFGHTHPTAVIFLSEVEEVAVHLLYKFGCHIFIILQDISA